MASNWGEGDIGNSILKAFYHKLALSTSLTKLKNFVMTHYPGLPPDRLYRHSKHVAQKALTGSAQERNRDQGLTGSQNGESKLGIRVRNYNTQVCQFCLSKPTGWR